MSKITTSDFQKGMFIIFKNEPNQIMEFQHVNPGKGSAFIRTKLKSLKSDRVQEFTYKSGETVEEYPVFVKEMQFLYKNGTDLVFMDQESYEQTNLPETLAGNYAKFMKAGEIYQVMIHDQEALGMRFPKKVRLTVTEAEEGVKGNTVTGARKTVLNENGRNIAELLIKELLWARYYENNTIDTGKVAEIQTIIDKYLFLRNEIASGRGRKEHDRIADFILDVLACEIEENLSPDTKNEAFINYVYQLIRPQIAPFNGNKEVRDIQVYIAVLKSFGHFDLTTIRYNLLKLMLPDITKITWQSSDKVLPGFYEVYAEIEKNLNHPSAERTRNIVKKLTPPFFILKDIFKTNPKKIEEILTHEGTLKSRVDETCRKRYEETKSRLRRTGVRSFIYILLTKVVFALILEIPYDLYIIKSVSYIPIFTNIIFPPALMTVIILSVTVPGDENTRKIFNFIKDLVVTDPSDTEAFPSPIVVERKTGNGMLFTTFFPFIYLFTYLLSFGTMIYVLSYFHFNPVSQGIFIFFVTLVSFFAYRVVDITREYLVVDREGPLTSLVDFFFLPIIRVGQWLSGEVLTRFNLLIFIFDFIIEMPLKAIVEIIDEWIHFVRIKKEEMI